MGRLQMRDRDIDDNPVILKMHNQPHAFTRSDFHRFCDTCTQRFGAIIHDYETVRRAAVEREINMARYRRKEQLNAQ